MDLDRKTVQVNNTPVIERMRAHRSVRSFSPEPVSDEVVEAIVEAAQWASSSCFRQTYSVIAVKDPDAKRELRRLCGKQRWIEECAVFLAFCVDMNRLDEIDRTQEKSVNLEYTETLLMAVLDVALLLQNAALAAESLGLGIVMIGGLRDNPREITHLLKLPRGVFGISGMCLGYPLLIPEPRPRLPLGEVLHWEQYQSNDRLKHMQDYDQTIRTAAVYRKKDGTLEGWTDVMARTTSRPPADNGRRGLREYLLEQGFELK